jgi:hypothetical protein
MFYDIYQTSSEEQKRNLETFALEQGRIWEPEIKAVIAEAKLRTNEDYIKLVSMQANKEDRIPTLTNVLKYLSSIYPEKGLKFRNLLEDLSVKIDSTESESKIIHQYKAVSSGGGSEDLSLRVMSQLSQELLKWSRKQQWAFILFLRGDAPEHVNWQRDSKSSELNVLEECTNFYHWRQKLSFSTV